MTQARLQNHGVRMVDEEAPAKIGLGRCHGHELHVGHDHVAEAACAFRTGGPHSRACLGVGSVTAVRKIDRAYQTGLLGQAENRDRGAAKRARPVDRRGGAWRQRHRASERSGRRERLPPTGLPHQSSRRGAGRPSSFAISSSSDSKSFQALSPVLAEFPGRQRVVPSSVPGLQAEVCRRWRGTALRRRHYPG